MLSHKRMQPMPTSDMAWELASHDKVRASAAAAPDVSTILALDLSKFTHKQHERTNSESCNLDWKNPHKKHTSLKILRLNTALSMALAWHRSGTDRALAWHWNGTDKALA